MVFKYAEVCVMHWCVFPKKNGTVPEHCWVDDTSTDQKSTSSRIGCPIINNDTPGVYGSHGRGAREDVTYPIVSCIHLEPLGFPQATLVELGVLGQDVAQVSVQILKAG